MPEQLERSFFDRSQRQATMNRVTGIQFSVLSADAILKQSVCEVGSTETLRNDGRPIQNGVLDPRMGLDHHGVCTTCNQPSLECNGHYGHITLPRNYPLYNMLFRAQLLRIFNALCLVCGQLSVPRANAASAMKGARGIAARLGVLHKLCASAKECACCGQVRTIVSWQNFKLVSAATSDAPACVQQPKHMYSILDRLDTETIALMGFVHGSHPRDLMNVCIPVIPPCARPGVVIDDYRAEDDITVKYVDLLKTRHALIEAEASGHPTHILDELFAQMQMHWATLQRNDIGASVTKGGRPTKCIYSRLSGKEGRMRQNVQGGRVNNAARTVITGDPNLEINEVGIPRSVAATLTVEERVNTINRDAMQELLDDERVNFVHRGGRVYSMEVKRRLGQRMQLETGDKVERHLKNGDWVLFNRQPTLHKQGLLGMRVHILPSGSTFRMNLAITGGFNADFDGDEMNCFSPLGIEARAEAMALMSSDRHIMSASASKPVIAIIQDSLLNSAVMSRDDVYFERDDFFQLCTQLLRGSCQMFDALPAPALREPDRWSGKQALSMCLPHGLYTHVGGCVIENGRLIHGTYNKKVLGTSRGSLVHHLHVHFGNDVVARFLDNQQHISNEFAMQYGASVGIGDAVVDASVDAHMTEVITETRAKIAVLLEGYAGAECLPIRVEARVNALLNACRDQAGHLVQKALDPRNNNLLKMIQSGSKGSAINIAQISGCVGQQNVDGARIAAQFEGRTLPHFKRGDFTDRARGFIAHSYLQGLSPEECFFHAKAGREGLCDTALRTSESGYMQRRCIKAMEDIKIEYDGTVRDGDGRVFQFAYGEDNMDATMLEKHTLLSMSEAHVWNKVELRAMGGAAWAVGSCVRVHRGGRVRIFVAPVMCLDDTQRAALHIEATALHADANMVECILEKAGGEVMLPIDVEHYLRAGEGRYPRDEPADPWDTARMVTALISRLELAPGGIAASLRYHLRTHLASKVLNARGTSLEALAFTLRGIELACARSRVQPGEAVGIIAAQSLGEPMTQSTLNTFHFTGVSSMRATTQGLPRFREILGATEHPQTPIITAPILPGVDARSVQRRLDHLRVGEIVVNTFWYEDSGERNIPIPEVLVASWLPPSAVSTNSSTCVRIELDRVALRQRAFATDDGTTVDPVCFVAWRIEKALGVFCEPLDANATHPVICVRAYPGSVHNASHALLERAILAVDVHGHEGFTDVRRCTSDDGSTTWLEMLGTNLQRVIGAESVDGTRVTSNHVRDVWRTLGIEAARATLVQEMKVTVEGGGSSIDVRHIFLVADLMTIAGDVAAVSRYGTNRSGRGPITRSSFEQTVEVLADAAIGNVYDPIGGVSDRIFLGQRPRVGAGAMSCMLDEQLFARLAPRSENGEEHGSDDDDENMFEAPQLVSGTQRSFDPFAEGAYTSPFALGRTPVEASWSPIREESSAWSPSSPPGTPTPEDAVLGEDEYEPGVTIVLPHGMACSDDLFIP